MTDISHITACIFTISKHGKKLTIQKRKQIELW